MAFDGMADGLLPAAPVLAPLAGVLARAVPDRPADDGLFGPRSLVWRVHRDRSFPLAGIRSLLMQALHPLAMAGVDQHSAWRDDPGARLASTSGYVLTVTYGERAVALAAGDRVHRIHRHVTGSDPVTGLAYRAEDPALLLWVHAAMVDSILTVVERYGRPLEPGDGDRYVAEMARFAEIVGVPREMVPDSVAALAAYLASVDLLQATPAARDAMAIVLDPPGLDPDTAELWREVGTVAVGTLPGWARAMYGYATPDAALLEREPVRQLLGVLDLAYETLPGVLDARRRIELRMRAAA